MEFLKAILGDELYAQVETAINAHNGNEANKDNQIKVGNLGGGEYVSKAKHDALQALLDGKTTELTTANNLIEELKKGTKDDKDLQDKVSEYETQVAQLQEELKEAKIRSALKLALTSEKALDIDYVTFKIEEKLKEKGKKLELDDNENIKGWDDLISDIKTQYPTQFEKVNPNNRKVLGDNRLPGGDNGPTTVTKEDFLKMGYEERLKLKKENEQLFKQLSKK